MLYAPETLASVEGVLQDDAAAAKAAWAVELSRVRLAETAVPAHDEPPSHLGTTHMQHQNINRNLRILKAGAHETSYMHDVHATLTA